MRSDIYEDPIFLKTLRPVVHNPNTEKFELLGVISGRLVVGADTAEKLESRIESLLKEVSPQAQVQVKKPNSLTWVHYLCDIGYTLIYNDDGQKMAIVGEDFDECSPDMHDVVGYLCSNGYRVERYKDVCKWMNI